MANTEEQELNDQIQQLSAKLRIYKKALTNPHTGGDAQIFLRNILWLEAEIGDLKAQLEVCQLLSMMFNVVTQPYLHGQGEDFKKTTLQNLEHQPPSNLAAR